MGTLHLVREGKRDISRKAIELLCGMLPLRKINVCRFAMEYTAEGKAHVQWFIQFKDVKKLHDVRSMLRGLAHVIEASGTAHHNWIYCGKGCQSKEEFNLLKCNGPNYGKNVDIIFEYGTPPSIKGKQLGSKKGGDKNAERWDQAWESARTGRMLDIPSDLRVCHYNVFKKVKVDFGDRPEDIIPVPGVKVNFWFYGKSGTGKSLTARREFPGAYFKSAANKWWDGYQGESVVIIDDFDKDHKWQGHNLKIWLDCYAFGAEVKGCSVLARPKTFVITSNWHPNEVWDDHHTLEPLLRRTKVVRFVKLGQPTTVEENTDEVRSFAPGFTVARPPPPEVDDISRVGSPHSVMEDSLDNIMNS